MTRIKSEQLQPCVTAAHAEAPGVNYKLVCNGSLFTFIFFSTSVTSIIVNFKVEEVLFGQLD